MVTDTLEKLHAEALRLTAAERAELACTLVESLDAPADADPADDWNRELMRRLAEVDADVAVVVDRDEFRHRMQARLAAD